VEKQSRFFTSAVHTPIPDETICSSCHRIINFQRRQSLRSDWLNLYGCTYPIESIVFERGFQLSNSSFSAYENTYGYRSRTRTKGCPFPQRDGSSGDYVLEHIPSACQFEYDDKFYGK
jgi:hypothetical protein